MAAEMLATLAARRTARRRHLPYSLVPLERGKTPPVSKSGLAERWVGFGSAIGDMRNGGMRDAPEVTAGRHGFSRKAMACQVSQGLLSGNFDHMVWLESKESPVVEYE
ncbi:hypothetical protein ACWGCI_31815 [Streptomyces sp. NPDC054949]